MSSDELRVKCAELMGWTPCVDPDWEEYWLNPANSGLWHTRELPDYCRDLNACAQLRASLTEEERYKWSEALQAMFKSGELKGHITRYMEDFQVADLTAEQNCRLFLAAKGA